MGAAADQENLWYSVILELLRPLIELCLDHSLSLPEFSEAARQAFFEAARRRIEGSGEELSASRLSMMTGIYREEISKILKRKKDVAAQPRNIISRVLVQWTADRRFLDSSGEPRVLSFKGTRSDFWKLAKTVSKNLNPSAVAQEMLRLGYVTQQEDGLKVAYREQVYSTDLLGGFSLVARDIESLLRAAGENMLDEPPVSNVHMHTEYDNIVADEIPQIRRWMLDHSRDYHRRVREYLSQYDRDINPDLPGGRRAKVVVGGFSVTSPLQAAAQKAVPASKEP